MLIVNFKTYLSATGERAVELARVCRDVARETGADIRVAVQAADIYRVASQVDIPVYAEHIDSIEPGRNTGYILPEDVRENGAVGTLLNHSEHTLAPEQLEQSVREAKEAGLRVILCAPDAGQARILSGYEPEYVAVEPPELIGGDVSVSSAKPALIKESVAASSVPLLVGAGVHTAEDVRVALELGAKGVLLASGVTKARAPREVLLTLARAG